MKIEIEEIKYIINIPKDEINDIPIDRTKCKEVLLSYDWALKASVNDMGPFVWVELIVSPEVSQELISSTILKTFQDYLI